MIRLFSLVRKRRDLSRAEPLDHWAGEHVERAIRVLDREQEAFQAVSGGHIGAKANRLDVHLADGEIAARLATADHPPPRYSTGVLAKYARLVGSAATGARVGA